MVGDTTGFRFVSFIHIFFQQRVEDEQDVLLPRQDVASVPVVCTMAYIALGMCGSRHRLCKLFFV